MENEIEKLTPRQAKILTAVVKEHCELGEEIASGDIKDKYFPDLSGATIRNEMQVLEKLGFLQSPHTSAGRVPTDRGYKLFINELMGRVKLTIKEQDRLKSEIQKLHYANQEISRRLSRLLADASSQASFTVFPESSYGVGLSNVLESSPNNPNEVKELAKFFDDLDERAEMLIQEFSDSSTTALVGKDLQIIDAEDYSMIVSGLSLPSGKKGVLGLIGPKAMPYDKAMTLLEYVTKLLKNGGTLSLITILLKPYV